MKTIITYGTFDLLHIGHVNLLKRLHNIADRVVVGCSTDAFNEGKGKRTVMPFKQRVAMLGAVRYVDHVIAEESWEQKAEDIQREGADIFAIGEDWAGQFDHLQSLCEVVYLPRTEGISTTDVRQMVSSLHEEQVAELRQTVERLQVIVGRM